MNNFVKYGSKVSYTNGSTPISSGDVVVAGVLVGIAIGDIAANATGELSVEGVYTLPKDTSTAISQGDKLFWNAGSSKITKTVTDTPIGLAYASQLSADATVNVLLYEQGPGGAVAATVAANSTANATDLASAVALANSLKTTLNSALANLKAAGLMAS